MNSEFISVKMPSIAPSGRQVLAMLEEDNPDMLRLTEAIVHDPVLASAVLKYANAPMYRRMVEVTNVRQAISILGLRNVRLAVMVASMRSFSDPYAHSPIAEALWTHSFAMAGLTKAIAQMAAPQMAEDLELTGLLHEMGGLILLTNFPEEYQQVVREALAEGAYIEDREKDFFGVTHNELVSRLIDEIRLPDVTLGAITDFPFMRDIQMVEREVDYHIAILALAHHIYEASGRDPDHPLERYPGQREELMALLELSEEDMVSLSEQFDAIQADLLSR
ncbi:MAG: HDOD domain-containing protein [Pseudomonadota bacterium]